MRTRSNSGVRLDYFQRLVNKTILKHQDPVTGLFPATAGHSHAWVRDNVYSILAVWGLALAYRKNADLDEDLAKSYELEQSVVKLMRGLLRSMMLQTDKLEKFKYTQSPKDSLHAKYSSKTGKVVVGDSDWGHLQIDATSLYLLFLSQMTASGLQIIYTSDEVTFIQNLVFYIETAYRTPDYGVWERGDKTNHGLPELNSSSIGMAKAALEAINELDLFGARGGASSIIHSLPDEAQQCQAILHSMLPRESSSKEIDAALITVISFPAFAVDDVQLIERTRQDIQQKLMGRYGCCRFLRDGYKTAREDKSRLHYEPWELQQFENIECQWPVFFVLFMLDGLFNGNVEEVERFRLLTNDVIDKMEDGTPLMPEMYTVPKDKVDLEYHNPNSQMRVRTGKFPTMWAQSLYILGRLVDENFVSPGELDPLNRRLVTEPKPDVVVQVVIMAEESLIQGKLAEHGIHVQTLSEVAPIRVFPARVLSQIYALLGKNKKMGLTGRPSSEIGLLATSKLYVLQDQILAFIPQFVDQNQFYLPLDTDFLVDHMRNIMENLAHNWRMMGRPTFICPINGAMLDQYSNLSSSLISTIKKLQSGYIAGTRVHLGTLSDFVSTSCVTKLNFVGDIEDTTADSQLVDLISDMLKASCPRLRLLSFGKGTRKNSRSSVHGIVRRSCSISVDAEQIPAIQAQIQQRLLHSTQHQVCRPRSGAVSSQHRSTSNKPTSHRTTPHLPLSHRPSSLPNVRSLNQDGTRSPSHVDPDPMHMHLRGSHSPAISPMGTPTPSPSTSPKLARKMRFTDRGHNNENHHEVNVHELVEQLSNTENLNEQGDIIHFLYMKKGPDWDTEVDGKSCTVRELLVELYEKAGHWKQWWLVRHSAGMLKKRVEDLALAATDLLVRQKQLSVGLPPDREQIITRPLPPDELASIIYESCGEDVSTASLTQEILIYLAMFIRTEPKLFHEMLRLRVGLIIQVMASELARIFKCPGEEASDHLLNLSPYELKTLLHHILSGKEFTIKTAPTDYEDEYRLYVVTKQSKQETSAMAATLYKSKTSMKMMSHIPGISVSPTTSSPVSSPMSEDEETEDRQGQWLRRRRLDGALNRVPVGFYTQVWKVLQKCHGLSIGGQFLPQSLTREMTSGEFKFALQVETVLNTIPQPEYRQLMVEALMVVTLLVESDTRINTAGQAIHIDRLVHEANDIFISDQKIPPEVVLNCKGAAGICLHLYDTAPSGRFGTMSYLCRALAKILNLSENIECVLS